VGLSRTVYELDGDFRRKSQNFPTPLYFALHRPLKGFAVELRIGAWVKKLEWWAIGVFSCLDTIHQRDRQTDRQRATAKTALTHSVAR